MRRNLLFVILAGLFLACAATAWPECPGQTWDSGICDTMYLEVYPPDTLFSGSARALILVTHDVLDPTVDSLAGFDIPLCFTRTNPAKYCSVSYYWNNSFLYPYPPEILNRSIFRHLIEDGDTLIHNWMMSQSEMLMGLEWHRLFMNLDDTSHFWFITGISGISDQAFAEGSRVLLLTITFRMEDTMTVCIDSCVWPPSTHLYFFRADARAYVPRHFLPYCFSVSYPELGDPNADGVIDIGDVVYLINYLYRASPSPVPTPVGDTNCDGVVDIGDVVFLINYLFRVGPPPSC